MNIFKCNSNSNRLAVIDYKSGLDCACDNYSNMTRCPETSFSSMHTYLSGITITLLFHPAYIFCCCFVLLFCFYLFIIFFIFVLLFCSILHMYFVKIQWMEQPVAKVTTLHKQTHMKQFIPCKYEKINEKSLLNNPRCHVRIEIIHLC